MRAVVFDQCGEPESVLELRDMPKPVLGRGEVLVRMLASPVNPSDLMFIRGEYGLKPNLPATPGFEGVGVVEASGGGLLGRLRKGKRVAVVNDRRGNWSEWTVTSARLVIPVPEDMPDEQAASFFVNPATALVMTKHVLRIPRGAWLLQTAAGSELGKMVIRLGRLHGFRTVNVVRREEQIDELKKLGADHVLASEGSSFVDRVAEITGGGVKFAIDPVGGATGTAAAMCLAPGGRMLAYGALSGEPYSIHPRFLITGSKRIEGFWLTDWARSQSVITMLKLFRQMRALIGSGVLATDVAETYPLDRVREAVAHASRPGRGGKIQLRIGA